MKRSTFILSAIAASPLGAFGGISHPPYQASSKPFKVNAGEARFGTRYKMKGLTSNTLDIKISGKDTDNALAVFEQTGQTPNGGPPLHIHIDQDEWFFVTEGEYLFQCGTDRFQLKAGDTIFLPRNIPHAFIQLTENARTIVSFMPAGKMEAFFAITDKWISVPTREELAKIFANHGMKIVGAQITL